MFQHLLTAQEKTSPSVKNDNDDDDDDYYYNKYYYCDGNDGVDDAQMETLTNYLTTSFLSQQQQVAVSGEGRTTTKQKTRHLRLQTKKKI